MGVEQPIQNRFRVSLEWRHRTDNVGEPKVNEVKLREERLNVQIAWAPHERVLLLMTAPFVYRSVEYVNLAQIDSVNVGDIELRGKIFIYRDRRLAPKHLLSVLGGVKLPTAPLERSANGALLPIELQSGTGSIDPIFGAAYAFFNFPWSAYASVQGMLPTYGNEGFRGSPSMRTTCALQYQLSPEFALRPGMDTRLDGKALEAGVESADSGGFIGYLTLEALVNPWTDVLLFAGARVPVLNALNGKHREGPVLSAGVALDF